MTIYNVLTVLSCGGLLIVALTVFVMYYQMSFIRSYMELTFKTLESLILHLRSRN